MLTPTSMEIPATSIGARRLSISACEVLTTVSALCGRSTTTVNSSPPMRAMKPRVAQRLLETLRDFAQHPVADVVTQRVVHFLEAAQVEHQQRDRRLRAVRRQHSLQVRQQRARDSAARSVSRGWPGAAGCGAARAARGCRARWPCTAASAFRRTRLTRNFHREDFAAEAARIAFANGRRAAPRDARSRPRPPAA